MSEKYLGRRQQPSIAELDTVSLRKYMQMIDAWGGWGLFQELLTTLNRIAQKYNVSIANVATRYILDKAAVAGVIVGVRLGMSDHRNNNAQVFKFGLDKSDYNNIDAICTKSNNLRKLEIAVMSIDDPILLLTSYKIQLVSDSYLNRYLHW